MACELNAVWAAKHIGDKIRPFIGQDFAVPIKAYSRNLILMVFLMSEYDPELTPKSDWKQIDKILLSAVNKLHDMPVTIVAPHGGKGDVNCWALPAGDFRLTISVRVSDIIVYKPYVKHDALDVHQQ